MYTSVFNQKSVWASKPMKAKKALRSITAVLPASEKTPKMQMTCQVEVRPHLVCRRCIQLVGEEETWLSMVID